LGYVPTVGRWRREILEELALDNGADPVLIKEDGAPDGGKHRLLKRKKNFGKIDVNASSWEGAKRANHVGGIVKKISFLKGGGAFE